MTAPARGGWRRWARRLLKLLVAGVLLVVVLAVAGYFILKNPRAVSWIATRIVHFVASRPLKPPPVAREDPVLAVALRSDGRQVQTPADLYSLQGLWDVRLRFSSNQWADLGPRRIESLPSIVQSDNRPAVRNPAAPRPGVAGVLGFDQPWSTADLEISGLLLTNVPVRFKGNGTFLDSLGSYRKPFKVSLGRSDPPRRFARLREFNLSNMAGDPSCARETLAYELHREAGVPASRTAYVRLRLSIDGRFENGLLGLYLLVENPDADWLERTVGVPGGTLFKPVTYNLFEDLGEDWKAYAEVYDPKGPAGPDAQRKLMELCRLVSRADDAEFAQRIGQHLDLQAFATFMACQVLMANYDSILATGQNFLVYLDPRDGLFRFVPWDMDRAFGNIPFVGTEEEREQASLRRPWVGTNLFLERMFAVLDFQARYDAELRRISASLFRLERLERRAIELADRVRPFVAEESMERLSNLERAMADPATVQPGEPGKENIPNLRKFLAARVRSVEEQLAGRSAGLRPEIRRAF